MVRASGAKADDRGVKVALTLRTFRMTCPWRKLSTRKHARYVADTSVRVFTAAGVGDPCGVLRQSPITSSVQPEITPDTGVDEVSHTMSICCITICCSDCTKAAVRGHFDCLRRARKYGCPLNHLKFLSGVVSLQRMNDVSGVRTTIGNILPMRNDDGGLDCGLDGACSHALGVRCKKTCVPWS